MSKKVHPQGTKKATATLREIQSLLCELDDKDYFKITKDYGPNESFLSDLIAQLASGTEVWSYNRPPEADKERFVDYLKCWVRKSEPDNRDRSAYQRKTSHIGNKIDNKFYIERKNKKNYQNLNMPSIQLWQPQTLIQENDYIEMFKKFIKEQHDKRENDLLKHLEFKIMGYVDEVIGGKKTEPSFDPNDVIPSHESLVKKFNKYVTMYEDRISKEMKKALNDE